MHVSASSSRLNVLQEHAMIGNAHDRQADVDASLIRRQMFGPINSLRGEPPAVVVSIKGLTPPRGGQEVVLHLVWRGPAGSWKIVEMRELPHLGLPRIQAPSRIVIIEPSGPTNVTVGLPSSNPT